MAKKSKDLPTQVVFSAYYRVHPDDRQAFVDAVVPHLEYTQQQEGCVYYEFAADLLDPNTIHLSEAWADQDAIEVHHASEPFTKALRTVLENVRILEHQGQRYEIAEHRADNPPGGVPTA